MPWGAAIAAVGAIGSSALSSSASSSAAAQQEQAAQQASQTQLAMFDKTQSNLSPFLQGGQNSLQALMGYLGIGSNGTVNTNSPGLSSYSGAYSQPWNPATYQQSPGYQWQLNQGINAVQNSAAAKGGVAGGNTLEALTQYGQGAANQDYYNAMNAYNSNQLQAENIYNANQGKTTNALFNLAGAGQNAAASLGGFSGATAGQIGSNIIGAGNAAAAGTVGSANALAGGVNSSLGSLAYLLGQSGSGSQTLDSPYSLAGYNPSVQSIGGQASPQDVANFSF